MQRRAGAIARTTTETSVELTIDLDGGPVEISTSIDFLDHMLHAFAKHSGCGLFVRASGDGMDNHHVIEDVGIALGKAISDALGDKRGIARFGSIMVPLDEALVSAAIDISGRPYLNFRVSFLREDLGQMPTEMIGEFFRAVTDNAKITAHLLQMNGHVAHHVCEATFKAFARAFAMAKALTAEESVPSTKGVLE
ncbi:MAG TPA: imidazoleglycerol-phosphate dehydratase HisB [Candidatus Baltobacteraceae bacterium]|nr:imidazoleglycerol-phosphate dehydratase HisB [Candidatus Baltobacteraceae bacterium]